MSTDPQDWMTAMASPRCMCGHLRIDHPTPHLCGIEGCHCGEFAEQPTVQSVLGAVEAFLTDPSMVTDTGWLGMQALVEDIRELRVEPDDQDDLND